MKFIKCHFFADNTPVYISPDCIEVFFEDELPEGLYTKILTSSGSVYVIESPEEIIAQITLVTLDKELNGKTNRKQNYRKRKSND